MQVQTNSQKMAQRAYSVVRDRLDRTRQDDRDRYVALACEFPSLVHSCGLVQAVAFALAKGGQHAQYAEDLAAVLRGVGYAKLADSGDLAKETREVGLTPYLVLSRDALSAAVWLKRYVEASGRQQVSRGG